MVKGLGCGVGCVQQSGADSGRVIECCCGCFGPGHQLCILRLCIDVLLQCQAGQKMVHGDLLLMHMMAHMDHALATQVFQNC